MLKKYVGESEAVVREAFATARATGGCVLLDDVESFAGKRAVGGAGGAAEAVFMRILSTLLNELDDSALCVATTHSPSLVDDALLRRFPVRVELQAPTESDRVDLLEKFLEDEQRSSGLTLAADAHALARELSAPAVSGGLLAAQLRRTCAVAFALAQAHGRGAVAAEDFTAARRQVLWAE